jgi:hypothetical protein
VSNNQQPTAATNGMSSSTDSSSTTTTAAVCQKCGNSNSTGTGTATPLQKCAACKCVEYCGRDCQRSTWKWHKQLCKAVTNTNTTDNNHCLILDGMGALGCKDINTNPIAIQLLQRNMQVSVVHLDDGFVTPQQMALALSKGKFSTCIILGWGSGDDIDLGLLYANSKLFQNALVKWVQNGGRLLVQGERISHAAGDWPEWFGLSWKSSDYCRTTHLLNANHHWAFQEQPQQAQQLQALLPMTMDVKACLVKGVSPDDNLFGTIDTVDVDGNAILYKTPSLAPGMGGKPVGVGQSCFALAKYGTGTVSYFGDVNAEVVTIATVAAIATQSIPPPQE